jgi:hypothetical protein
MIHVSTQYMSVLVRLRVVSGRKRVFNVGINIYIYILFYLTSVRSHSWSMQTENLSTVKNPLGSRRKT